MALVSTSVSLVCCYWLWVGWGAEYYHRLHVSEKLVDRLSYLQVHPEFGWSGKPGFSGDWPLEPGTPKDWVRNYRLDEHGFRDHVYSEGEVERDSLDYKIWVLGDSSPFGFGCDGDKTLGAEFRREYLEQRVGVRLYNVVGYNARQLAQLLKSQLDSERPSVLVVWAGFNDLEFTKERFYTAGVSQGVAFARYRKAMEEILGQQIPTVLVTVPHLEPSPELVLVNEWVRKQDQLHHVTVVDLEAEFEKLNSKALYAPIDERLPMHFHPSEKGHGLAYRWLQPAVASLL